MATRRTTIKNIEQTARNNATKIDALEGIATKSFEQNIENAEEIKSICEKMESFSERMESVSCRLGLISEKVDAYAEGYQAGYDHVLSSFGKEVFKIKKILMSESEPLAKIESVSRYVDQALRRFKLQEFSPASGERFDSSSMEVVGTIATEDQSMIGMTATCIGSGVTSQGRTILRPKVTLYVPKEEA